MRPNHRQAVPVALAILLVAAGVLAEWLHSPGRIGLAGLIDLATGWAIGSCGLLAWARVPRSLVGPLLTATAFAWFLGTVGDSRSDLGRVALALLYLYAGLLAHALFTWPMGRSTRSLDRVLVTGGYLVAIAAPLWQRDAGVLVIGSLLAGGLVVQHASLPFRTRATRRPALVAGFILAVALLSKRLLAQRLQQAGVAVGGDPDTLWSLALVIAAGTLAWGLLVFQRRPSQVADLVVQLGEGVGAGLTEALAGSLDDPAVHDALSNATRLMSRNAGLRTELAEQVMELEASRRRLLEIGDDEGRELEERLRIGAAARLTDLEVAVSRLTDDWGPDPTGVLSRLRRATEQLHRARAELREIARGLDPVVPADGGLAATLRELAARCPVPMEVAVSGDLHAATSVQTTLYYVASEAIANVIRHARAAHVWLRLTGDAGELRLEVEDDGVGGADPVLGSGLRGLQDRLDALGGSLQVVARPAGGTRLAARVPAGIGGGQE